MPSANTKNTNKKKIIDLIEKNKGITNYAELTNMLGVSKTYFYKRKYNEDQEISEAINKNCVAIKMSLKKKWYDSGNFSAEVCLFKLLADKDELERLQIVKDNSNDESQSLIIEFLKKLSKDDPKQDDEFDKKQEDYELKNQC